MSEILKLLSISPIAFDKYGNAIVEVSIKGVKTSPHLPILKFKVDTGASSSTISIEALAGLGYTADWVRETGYELSDNRCNFQLPESERIDRRPRGFSGDPVGGFYEVSLPFVKLGLNCAYDCKFLTRIDAPQGAPPISLLLGMDVLSNFNWVFDFDNSVFGFRYRRSPNSPQGTKRGVVFCEIDELQSTHA